MRPFRQKDRCPVIRTSISVTVFGGKVKYFLFIVRHAFYIFLSFACVGRDIPGSRYDRFGGRTPLPIMARRVCSAIRGRRVGVLPRFRNERAQRETGRLLSTSGLIAVSAKSMRLSAGRRLVLPGRRCGWTRPGYRSDASATPVSDPHFPEFTSFQIWKRPLQRYLHGSSACRKTGLQMASCTNAAYYAASGNPLIGFPTKQQPGGLLLLLS